MWSHCLLTLALLQHPDRFDTLVRSFIAEHRIPSAAIAIVQHEKILKAAGYGPASLELAVPAGPNTLYEIGSITKTFTALAVLQLVEQGKLELDAPVSRFVPALPEAWSGISVRQLLSHTSGLSDWEGKGLISFRRDYSLPEFIALIAQQPLGFAPGSQWRYSNSEYPLLGELVTRVSGEPYETYVARHLFAPAGMRATRFRRNDAVIPNRAAGYVDSAGAYWNGEPRRPALLAPNGGILSTALDMARWHLALSRGQLVRPATLDSMTTPVRLSGGGSFEHGGMGWFLDSIRGHRIQLHNGVTAAGYSSVIYRYPDDRLFVVVLLAIDRGAAVNELATGLAGLVIPALRPAPTTR